MARQVDGYEHRGRKVWSEAFGQEKQRFDAASRRAESQDIPIAHVAHSRQPRPGNLSSADCLVDVHWIGLSRFGGTDMLSNSHIAGL
jgi:hypothetical protein